MLVYGNGRTEVSADQNGGNTMCLLRPECRDTILHLSAILFKFNNHNNNNIKHCIQGVSDEIEQRQIGNRSYIGVK